MPLSVPVKETLHVGGSASPFALAALARDRSVFSLGLQMAYNLDDAGERT